MRILNENDEIVRMERAYKDQLEPNRDKAYEEQLNYRKKYLQKLFRMARIWNVDLLPEDKLPKSRKNVMKCEDSNSAFIDLKRRKYFCNMNLAKEQDMERLECIKASLKTLDFCHKQSLEYVMAQFPDQNSLQFQSWGI